MRIKRRYNRNVSDFATAFRVRKLFGTFEKRPPGPSCSKAEYRYPPDKSDSDLSRKPVAFQTRSVIRERNNR